MYSEEISGRLNELMIQSYQTFEEAYLLYLQLTRDAPQFCNSPRGFRSREILGMSYQIINPLERAIRTPSRRTNIVFNFAEVLWYLSGSNSLEFIKFYAPSIKKYSSDNLTLRGTAYGPRIFKGIIYLTCLYWW